MSNAEDGRRVQQEASEPRHDEGARAGERKQHGSE
jgi:hypothetical protein